jgi:hypothetical protein
LARLYCWITTCFVLLGRAVHLLPAVSDGLPDGASRDAETAFQCRRIIAWGFPTPLSRKTIRGFSLRGSEEDQVFSMREIAGPGPLVSFWPAGIQGWILGRVLLSTLPCGQGLWALMVWMGYFGFMEIRRGPYRCTRRPILSSASRRK